MRNRCSGTRASSCLSEERSGDDADRGERHRRPHARKLRRLQRKVNRNTRHVDQQRDGGRRRDELPFVDLESEHGGRSNAALIADQAAEKSGERSAKPRERAAKPPSFRVARHLRRAGEHEQRSEDDLERAACRPRVQQRAGQSACGARDAEALTTVQSNRDETARSESTCRCVWNGDGGNGKLGAVAAAMAGVSRLPMPKPATDATAPPKAPHKTPELKH